MSEIQNGNDIDVGVDEEIFNCLNPACPKSFFLFAGAGSGKTRSLVNVLGRFKIDYGSSFRLRRQKVAIITYTNAAADEITHRLEHDPIFSISTIHSFSWELISHLTQDIRLWLKQNIKLEIEELEIAQAKSRDLMNKTSMERARKIESKSKRLESLDSILKFTYNPNGDNTTRDALNHTEVIALTAYFIKNKPLMQDIVSDRFPVILVDESQDTKKDLIDSLFELQVKKQTRLSLGLFGDTMQRIYSDGKENLGRELPLGWITPSKKMNHRSNKRIINLVNDIRKSVDSQFQIPRVEKEEGFVKLFISPRTSDKTEIEKMAARKMAELTGDKLWMPDHDKFKILILEHHMAAKRMGFFDFFEPLYEQDVLKTGLLDGSLSSIGFFTRIILPLVEAHQEGNKFKIAKIVKHSSALLRKNELSLSETQLSQVKKANDAVQSLFLLWESNKEPTSLQVLRNVAESGLFPIPDALYPLATILSDIVEESAEPAESKDDMLAAWNKALETPFSQIYNYNAYLSESSRFGTHQGVKGLEYPRVMVIIDDEESKGFMFSYDKLFGAKELSTGDHKNIHEGKETGIDRTRRLFYVACSRAKESLAIVAYSDNPQAVRRNAIEFGWFNDEEIEIL
ncbi:ATP-dependent helicase [Pedobacter sp. HMWF019]|uniref:UvrD-helicase domain-containing protein n=1 Tax=Pedobacter sp. HMWF019 TaxID=2056856 RepID=UPI000D3DBA70|nr:UvrD-helicase domain-containing protein [Pedobacter sp. HMWF019]PTT03692.1 ATP-dependent helicase [Pedobacter sp. HMWF019]